MAMQIGRSGSGNRFMGVLGMVLAGFLMAALVSPAAEAKMTVKDKVGEKEIKLQIYGFSQIELRGGEGYQLSKGRLDDGPDFTAQRIRVGFNYFHTQNVAGKLFLDFNQSHSSDEAGLPKMIKDAFVTYRFNNAAFLRAGMIKTPLGMAFTVPGWNLDNIERSGLDKGLVLERDAGLMVSGRLIGQGSFEGKKQMQTNGLEMGTERQGYGFGYDLGVFNPAGRSSAVTWTALPMTDPNGTTVLVGGNVRGDALAYVGRLHFDYGPEVHVEAAYGVSEKAGGNIDNPTTPDFEESDDYKVFDIGVASELLDSELEVKGEYIAGTGIRGVENRDQSCYVVTVGWLFVPSAQLMVKTYQAEHEDPMGVKTDLGNTYVGFNLFPHRASDKHRDLQRHKIVVNYVLVNGDDVDSMTPWAGLGGYRDNTWAAQWQYKY
jgi:hypothetical protein